MGGDFYCRFCAELKNSKKLIDFNEDAEKYTATAAKLKFLNASYINILQCEDILPKTICISCDNSLCKAYEFMCNAKRAQETLLYTFCPNVPKTDKPLPENVTPFIRATSSLSLNHINADVKTETFFLQNEYSLQAEIPVDYSESLDDTSTFKIKYKKKSKHKHRSENIFEDVKLKKANKIKKEKSGPKLCKGYSTDDLICTICDRTFNCRRSIYDHMINHRKSRKLNTPLRAPARKRGTPITVEDLTCDVCHKVYSNQNSLRDHKTIHTDRNRDYTCDKCGKTFYKKGGLVTHIKIHEEVRPHVCKICNKSFTQPAFLRTHVQIHLGEKPFKCEKCGRCFRLKRQLKSHSLIHTDIMPYQCQYCEKRFRFSQILKNHERQHTGEKPYSCQECGRDFSNWSNYHKHTKRKHDIDIRKKRDLRLDSMVIEDPVGLQEWTSKVMLPGKPGKKNAQTKNKVYHISLDKIVDNRNQNIDITTSSYLPPVDIHSLISSNPEIVGASVSNHNISSTHSALA